MKNDHRRRKLSSISNSRWAIYATAGVASALPGARSSEAEIHYSGLLNIRMDDLRTTFLPLTGGASLEFTIFYSDRVSYPAAYFYIVGAEKGSALSHDPIGNVHVLDRVPEGHAILGKFGSVRGMPGLGAIKPQFRHGYFNYPRSSILGFKFDVGNGTQYGWARLYGSEHKFHYEIKEFAWADPGERILAGQRSSTELSVVSKVGSLGLLAVGAPGLDLWRRARSEASRG